MIKTIHNDEEVDINIGDTIHFAVPIAYRAEKGRCKVRAFNENNQCLVRFNTYPDFIVKDHEIRKVISLQNK